MHPYGIRLRLKWDWKLYRRFGFKRVINDQGYRTEWYTPIVPGVWLTNITEGPP